MTHTKTRTTTKTNTKTLTSTKSKTSTKTKTKLKLSSKLGGGLSFKQGMSFLNKKSGTLNNKSTTDNNNPLDSTEISINHSQNPTVKEIIAQTSGNMEQENKLKVNERAYWVGWARYFKVKKGQKPKSFFLNYSFQKQMKENPNINLQEKTNKGLYKHIRAQNYFFITVFEDNIAIASSREDKFKEIYDGVHIDLIAPIEKDKMYLGGIQDFGSFNEGFCFKIITTKEKLKEPLNKTNAVNSIEYLFCCDSQEEKEKFMGSLRYVKFQKQLKEGIVIASRNDKNGINQAEVFENLLSGAYIENSNFHNSTDTQIVQDGRWVILQNWSQCSLKCGGGETVLHRFCIPPIGNGKPCEGDSVIRKSCNTEPCKLYIEDLKQNKVITEKPEIKIMPFSERPQRYIKCKIKESDAMMYWETREENNSESLKKVLRPIRVVMNNFTLSIFENSNYYSNIMTFDLEKTKLYVSKEHPWCILIQQKIQQVELCPFSMDHKDTSFVEEWNYDFELFKNQCHVTRKVDLEEKINFKLRQKLNEIETDMNYEKQAIISKKLSEDEKNKLTKKIIESADITYQALQREINLEEMIKKEEEMKEKSRQEKLQALINLEEEKKKKLTETFREKELETQTLLETQEHELQLKKLKEEAAQKLLYKRNKLKKTLAEMRKKSQLEEANLTSKLLSVRNEIANTVKDANKKGNIENCKLGLQSEETRKVYCKVKFSDDYINFSKCDDEVDFCPTCCEREFGEMYMKLRKECLKTLCMVYSEKLIIK